MIHSLGLSGWMSGAAYLNPFNKPFVITAGD